MSESTEMRAPASRVLPHELPASLRDAGLDNWIREPLDDAVDRRRRIIMPPAAAVMGTPASAYQGALLAEARHPDTVFMMGDNPALPAMPARPTLKDFFELRFSKIARMHLLQSARVAREHGLDEKVIMACLLHDIAIAGRLAGGAHVADDDLAEQLPVGPPAQVWMAQRRSWPAPSRVSAVPGHADRPRPGRSVSSGPCLG